MKLGKEIQQIRKERGMTQEAFGQLFHVTRQTVSNWENEKSYPDLETLVDMSDRFGISLDMLLKEDAHMIQTIDKERRAGKHLLKGVIAAVCAVAIVCAGYCGYWYYQKTSFEEQFDATLLRYDFTQMISTDSYGNESFSGRYGSQQSEAFYFIEPPDFPSLLSFNTKIPDNTKEIAAIINVDGHKILKLHVGPVEALNQNNELTTYPDFTTLSLVEDVRLYNDGTVETNGSREYRLDSNGNLDDRFPFDDETRAAYDSMKSDVQTAVTTMHDMLQDFYA